MKLLVHANAIRHHTEWSQSIARLLISTVGTVYLWVTTLFSTAEPAVQQAAWYGLLFIAIAIVLHANIKLRPAPSVMRRILATSGDLGVISLALHLTGPFGAALYPAYLWVIVGNGLRFGIRYLFMALLIGAIGFTLVIAFTPLWQQNLSIAIGLLIGMVVLPLFYVSVLKELQDANKKLAEQIRETAFAATHDALTGLPNRYLFQDRLKQQMKLAQRRQAKLAVVFIDIDGFKHINDNYGHQAGDEVLREIGHRLRQTARAADTVARLGGDEFILLLTDIPHPSVITEAAKRIITVFKSPFPISGHTLTVTGSIGYSVYPDHSENMDGLISRADQAMYQTKRDGGNNFLSYAPAQSHMLS